MYDFDGVYRFWPERAEKPDIAHIFGMFWAAREEQTFESSILILNQEKRREEQKLVHKMFSSNFEDSENLDIRKM